MKTKGGREKKMSTLDMNWFFTPENLEKLSDEELLELEKLLRTKMQETQDEKAKGGG